VAWTEELAERGTGEYVVGGGRAVGCSRAVGWCGAVDTGEYVMGEAVWWGVRVSSVGAVPSVEAST
jgi:hypothetical protein